MKILVAVIAYNEEANLPAVIEDLRQHNFGYDILLVDNASSDNSEVLANTMGISYLRHCVNTGGAEGTVRSFFMYAHQFNYDIVVQFDGDGQHSAASIKDIVSPIVEGKADYVIGSRFLAVDGYKSNATRRIGIRLLSTIARIITGFKFSDMTSGARAFNKDIISFVSRNYHHQIYDSLQMALLGYYCKARFYEIPVIMKPREHGESGFNAGNSIMWMFKSVVNCFGFLVRYGFRRKNGT